MTAHAKSPLVIQRAIHQAGDLLRAPVEEAPRHRTVGFEHVDLHLLLVGEDFERTHEPRPAPVAQHARQRADRLIHLRRARSGSCSMAHSLCERASR